MKHHNILLAVSLGAALAACGGGAQQANTATFDSTAPAGNAGPPPGASPAPGVGDANTEATSAPPATIAMDGSNVAADGTNATSGGDDTVQGRPQADPTQDAATPRGPRQSTASPPPTQ